MKKIKQQKSGISLIVLVITIIVLIILAAAIILSLDGSDIIERSKGAQKSNDVATAKEVVSLAKSEWSFERKEGYDTFREYAESKLEEAGFDMDNTYVEDSGRVLFDTAARFAKAGVEIGAEVKGYTLNNTTTYITSGKENTCDEDTGETEPQPARVTRDSAIKWTYVGVDEDGNVMLAGSVTSTTPKVKLGGKGGYVNGPAELDKICEAMYSTSKGTARSMNIEDVIRVLEYMGNTNGYYDIEGNYISMKTTKTIGQIAKEIGYDMSNFDKYGPETKKEMSTYVSNYFKIHKTNNVSEYNSARENIIYPASTNVNLTSTYWLSSECIYAYFCDGCASFDIHHVKSNEVNSECMFYSLVNASVYGEYALRPVVILSSDIHVIYNGITATIN